MSHPLARTTLALLVAAGLAVAAAPADASTHHHSRPCFIVQAHWNTALDGPQPRC